LQFIGLANNSASPLTGNQSLREDREEVVAIMLFALFTVPRGRSPRFRKPARRRTTPTSKSDIDQI
jgi:hypothetical protein